MRWGGPEIGWWWDIQLPAQILSVLSGPNKAMTKALPGGLTRKNQLPHPRIRAQQGPEALEGTQPMAGLALCTSALLAQAPALRHLFVHGLPLKPSSGTSVRENWRHYFPTLTQYSVPSNHHTTSLFSLPSDCSQVMDNVNNMRLTPTRNNHLKL